MACSEFVNAVLIALERKTKAEGECQSYLMRPNAIDPGRWAELRESSVAANDVWIKASEELIEHRQSHGC